VGIYGLMVDDCAPNADVEGGAETPGQLELRCVSANPLRPGDMAPAEFLLVIPRASTAVLEIYDSAGRVAATPFSGRLEAGSHRVAWASAGMSSGVYHARLRTERAAATARIVIVR